MSYISNDVFSTFLDQQKWKLFTIVKTSHIASYDVKKSKHSFPNKKSPKICATIFCARKPGYYISNAIFLIFLITLCALTLFAIDPKLPHNRFQTTLTLILTSVSFKWVINRSLPTVSYLTSLDKYSSVSIFYLFLICVWHAIVGSFWELEIAIKLDRIMLGIFCLIFVLIQFIYAVWMYYARAKVRELEKEEKLFIEIINENLENMKTEL